LTGLESETPREVRHSRGVFFFPALEVDAISAQPLRENLVFIF
jgi:hypothetical protein